MPFVHPNRLLKIRCNSNHFERMLNIVDKADKPVHKVQDWLKKDGRHQSVDRRRLNYACQNARQFRVRFHQDWLRLTKIAWWFFYFLARVLDQRIILHPKFLPVNFVAYNQFYKDRNQGW